jgi:hypothetical protein
VIGPDESKMRARRLNYPWLWLAIFTRWRRDGGEQLGCLLGRQAQRTDKLLNCRAVRSVAVRFETLNGALAKSGPLSKCSLTETGREPIASEEAAKRRGGVRANDLFPVRHA